MVNNDRIGHLEGVMTALITPFKEGKVDIPRWRKLVNWQRESGISALVLCGTTGEGSTLREEEKEEMVQVALEEARRQLAILLCIGAQSTALGKEQAIRAEGLGVDGIVVTTPCYNCPTQEGLFAHFQQIARATRLPILLYHHPKRTGVSMSVEIAARLADIDNIVGIKEASSQVDRTLHFLHSLPPSFRIFAGNDELTLPLITCGAYGVVSVLSNLFPRQMQELFLLAKRGNVESARKVHRRLFPFFQALTVETNPIPIKAMMAYASFCEGECRLPLTSLDQKHREYVRCLLDQSEEMERHL